MNRIQRVSMFFLILFQCATAILPILMIWFWIQAPEPLVNTAGFVISFIPSSIYIAHTLAVSTKFYGFLISCIPNGITLLNLFLLIKLFKNFERGHIFIRQNVVYTRNIGVVMLVGQFLQLVYQALMSFTITFHNPSGHRVIQIGFSSWDMGVIATAVIIILVSWIMAEGYKLQEDKQLTI